MGRCILASALLYLLVAALPFGWFLVLPIFVAHAASGANWVFATVLLQRRTEDRLRGRIFATEWLFIMVADALSILAASVILERAWVGLHATIAILAMVQAGAGYLWLVTALPADERWRSSSTTAQS